MGAAAVEVRLIVVVHVAPNNPFSVLKSVTSVQQSVLANVCVYNYMFIILRLYVCLPLR